MRQRILGITVITAVATLLLAACGSDAKTSSGGVPAANGNNGTSSGAAGKGKVGVILPDTQTSDRWETADRPLLSAAFKSAGIEADIQNAQNDKSKMATIADGMIQSGVNVLLITNLDSPSGAAIEAKAKAAGVKTIDYDRLTLGGSADYYVSFDNNKVGQLQGEGLVKCIGDKPSARTIELNGSPTDNNATLFKQGYDSVLDKKYAEGWQKVGDRSVPNWDNAQAGQIFQQLLTAAGGRIDGVLAANDGLGNATITVLKAQGLKIPVTGQDATVEGLRNILRGDQCMTVYKAIKKEADAAAQLTIDLINGKPAQTNGTSEDPQGKRSVPSVLLDPQSITRDNVNDVIKDGYVKAADVCAGDVAALCKAAGVG